MNIIQNWADQQIVEGILAGGRAENEAIGALYDLHRGIFMRFIDHKSPKDYARQPEDIVWEAIEAFVNNVKQGKYLPQAGTNIEAYIKTICKNLWHKYLAAETAPENLQDFYSGFDLEHEPDIGEFLEDKEVWDYYLRIFDKAGMNCKEILLLSFAEDMPMKELAELLISEGKYENEQVVRNAKSKCLKKIVEFL